MSTTTSRSTDVVHTDTYFIYYADAEYNILYRDVGDMGNTISMFYDEYTVSEIGDDIILKNNGEMTAYVPLSDVPQEIVDAL